MKFEELLEQELSHLEEAGRLVHKETFKNSEAKVYWDSSLSEYTVKFYVGGSYRKNSDYFTDDKQDAMGTAKQMLKTIK